MVVASTEAGAALEGMIDLPCNFTSFTANEAARMLGMAIGAQEDSRFADPLHAAWCGRKVKFILKMDAADLRRIHQPRQVAAAMIVLLMAGTAYLGWVTASESQKMLVVNSDISDQKLVLSKAQTEYDAEVKRLETLGYDVKLIQSSLSTFRSFEEGRMHTLSLIHISEPTRPY